MKTFAELMVEAEGFQGKFTPDHDTKKQAIELGKKVNPKSKPGALALRPADKGRDIVKQKSGALATSKPGALANTPKPKSGALTTNNKPGDNSNKMGRVPNPYRYGQAPDGPQSRPQKPQKNKKKKGPGPVQKGFNFLKKGLNNTVTDGQPESSGGGIDAPKRGVYNG